MSYILQRYRCSTCGDEFNCSLGSFGGGFPKECANGHSTKDAELILDGHWKMNDGTIYPPIGLDWEGNKPNGQATTK